MVEFGLVVVILAMLAIGMAEIGRTLVQQFGLIYLNDHLGQAAARLGGYDEAVFDALINDNQTLFIDRAQLAVGVNTFEPDGSQACTSGRCACDYGQVIRVQTSYPAHIQILTLRWSLTLRASARLVCWRGGTP